MTPQERELLSGFLQQMTQAQAGQKDTEADALIREACARQPDAAYLLVQRALGLDCALQATQAQLAQLQSQADILRPGAQSSFISDPNAWGRPKTAAAPAARPASAPLAPLASNTLARGAAPAAAAPASSWGGGGMLGTLATTAAGVVAGSFLYQGIQGMMGNHNQPANSAANKPQPAPEPAPEAQQPEVADYAPDDSADYADSSGGDYGGGDSGGGDSA